MMYKMTYFEKVHFYHTSVSVFLYQDIKAAENFPFYNLTIAT